MVTFLCHAVQDEKAEEVLQVQLVVWLVQLTVIVGDMTRKVIRDTSHVLVTAPFSLPDSSESRPRLRFTAIPVTNI